MIVRSLAISMLIAGMALAQTVTPPAPAAPGTRGRGPNPGGRGPGRGGPRGPVDVFGPNAEARLTKQFGLNATQQNTLHTTLASAKVQTQGMREKETTLRTQLGTSVKAADEAGIERAATDIETLHQQQTAIRAKTLATIYGSLDATQKAKFEPLLNRELGIPVPRPAGAGRGAGRGPRPAPGAQPSTQQ
jgi:hypothetical protein